MICRIFLPLGSRFQIRKKTRIEKTPRKIGIFAKICTFGMLATIKKSMFPKILRLEKENFFACGGLFPDHGIVSVGILAQFRVMKNVINLIYMLCYVNSGGLSRGPASSPSCTVFDPIPIGALALEHSQYHTEHCLPQRGWRAGASSSCRDRCTGHTESVES